MGELRSQLHKYKISPNFKKNDLSALKDLKKKENVSILLSDKTNKICLMDKQLVEEKLANHLCPTGFKQLDADPSAMFEKEANALLIDCAGDADIDINSHGFPKLLSKYSTPAEVYPMGKDHKPQFPDTKVRVVQPITNSAIDKMDLLVSKVLTQIIAKLPNRVDSSRSFLKEMKTKFGTELTVPPGCIHASLDVENMYPTIPTCDRALNILRHYLLKYKSEISMFGFSTANITEMMSFLLKHTYVRKGNQYYLQTEGIGTGSHSSGAYAEIIIDYTYLTAKVMSPIDPTHTSTYVDDAWILWQGSIESFLAFKELLNSVWDSLNFTHELPENDAISFLDTKIKLRGTELVYEFYQKTTHSGRYLDYESHCSMITKTNIIRSEARRILQNCKYRDSANKHLEALMDNLVSKSGYPA